MVKHRLCKQLMGALDDKSSLESSLEKLVEERNSIEWKIKRELLINGNINQRCSCRRNRGTRPRTVQLILIDGSKDKIFEFCLKCGGHLTDI